MSRLWHGGQTGCVVGGEAEFGVTDPTNITVYNVAHIPASGGGSPPGALGQRYLGFSGAGYVVTRTGLNISTVGFLRARVWLTSGAINQHWLFFAQNSDPTVLAGVYLKSTGYLAIWNGTVDTAVMSTPFPRDQWVVVELLVGVERGVLASRINGVDWTGLLGVALGDTGAIDSVVWGPLVTAPGQALYMRDMAINDDTGPADSSWCGLGTLGLIVPDGITFGDASWSAQGGGALAAAIDDFPAATVDDATYVKETTGVFGASIHFTMPALPDGTLITSILAGMRAGGTSVADRFAFVQFIDGRSRVRYGVQTHNWNLNGFKTIFPVLVADREWWGLHGAEAIPQPGPWTMLTADYLSSLDFQLVRFTGTGELRVSALWLIAEALSVGLPAAPPIRRTPRVLADIGP